MDVKLLMSWEIELEIVKCSGGYKLENFPALAKFDKELFFFDEGYLVDNHLWLSRWDSSIPNTCG